MSKSLKLDDTYIDSGTITHRAYYGRISLAEFLNGIAVDSADQLLNVNVQTFFSIVNDITINGFTIPIYTKGIIMPIQSKDACLIAVDVSGNLYVGFRNGNSGWLNIRKI